MKKFLLLITFLLLTTFSFSVFAQTGNQQAGPSDTVISGQQGSESGSQSQRCSDVTRRVDSVTSRYDQKQQQYMKTFENVFQNIQQLALKFKADGYDTTKLEADLAQFSNMIQNTNRYYNEFRTGLDNSKKGVCGNSENEASQQFNSARQQLMNCKNEMLQLREFAQETLRQDLLDLKSQVTE